MSVYYWDMNLAAKNVPFSLDEMLEKIEVRDVSEDIGKGIFAKRFLKKEEIIWVLAGPVVYKPSINTVPIYWDGEDDWLFIDPLEPVSNMNHSCSPNAGIHGRTMVVAMRDIEKGEHITIDYAMIVPRYNFEQLPQTEEDLLCTCGTEECRGSFGAYKNLSEELKKKYRPYVSEYILELEEKGKL